VPLLSPVLNWRRSVFPSFILLPLKCWSCSLQRWRWNFYSRFTKNGSSFTTIHRTSWKDYSSCWGLFFMLQKVMLLPLWELILSVISSLPFLDVLEIQICKLYICQLLYWNIQWSWEDTIAWVWLEANSC